MKVYVLVWVPPPDAAEPQVWPVFTEYRPTVEDAIAALLASGDLDKDMVVWLEIYKGNPDGEVLLEIQGPWDVPAGSSSVEASEGV